MNRQNLSRPMKAQQRRGAAVVEFALVVPLFFTVVFGIVEFGQAFMVSQLLNSAAREGARTASFSGSTNADVESTVLQIIENSTLIDLDQVTVNVTVTPGQGNPNPDNQVVAATKRDLCTVDVMVGFSDVALVTGHFLEGIQLRGSCAMRHE